MQRTLICVAWSNGRWRVTESGPRNSIACFGERQVAMDYAAELAARTQGSSLRVRPREGEPCSNREAVRNGLPLDRKSIGARVGVPEPRLTVRS
jgi:hypothetical protein